MTTMRKISIDLENVSNIIACLVASKKSFPPSSISNSVFGPHPKKNRGDTCE